MKQNNDKIARFRELIDEQKLLSHIMTLCEWENETIVPRKGVERLSQMISYVTMKRYESLTSKEFGHLVDELAKDKESLDEVTRREIGLLTQEKEELALIPPAEYKEYSELLTQSMQVWQEAKQADDFGKFEGNLKRIFELAVKFCEYKKALPRYAGKSSYDIALDGYEKNMGEAQLDEFFGTLKQEIVPLLKQVLEIQPKEEPKYPKMDVVEQAKFSRFLSEYVGFDFERGVIAESEHPFTTTINHDDVRFTTKYIEDLPFSAVYSTIHESGHGIYEQQVARNLHSTVLADGASMGMHESQSRFYENILGRSKAFWEGIYSAPSAKEFSILKAYNPDDIYKAVNRVKPSLIRIEADELTYCLHIMIRYEIEKAIFAGKINISDLPRIWNEKMEEYLGIIPPNNAQGVLQDVHWSCGNIGYFPSYAIGNAYSAQIYATMSKDIDVEKEIKSGNLGSIKGWLGDKIHKYGMMYDSEDLLYKVTGEHMNPSYYIQYMKDKFLNIYSK